MKDYDLNIASGSLPNHSHWEMSGVLTLRNACLIVISKNRCYKTKYNTVIIHSIKLIECSF